jgi:predicted glutamine amidotransferase
VLRGQIEIDYESRVEGTSDSARAFTYMLDKIQEYRGTGRIRGLYPAIVHATSELLKNYEGTLNYLLSDGTTLYAFNHYPSKPVYFLRREKDYGGAILVSTQKLSPENWERIPPDRLLVLSKGEVSVLSDPIETS